MMYTSVQFFSTVFVACLTVIYGRNDRKATDSTQCTGTYRWIPEAEHRCNITQIPLFNFTRRFGRLQPLYHEPLIIQGGIHYNEGFRNRTSRQGIIDAFPPGFMITLSSSNSFSAHRRTIPLTQYLEEIQDSIETLPDQLSNETWYFFGETHSPPWRELLQHYQLPPCQTCTADLVALSFGMGNRGSGVQWHTHGPGFAEALHGRKHWVLYPPNQKPEFNPDRNSRSWMETLYFNESNPEPWECTLVPGDMIYFPNEWWHATINLDIFTSFVSTFTTEHGVFQ
jgi:hypothetical protein